MTSSLEVLAGLAPSTQEYTNLMISKDGKPSAFYEAYVRDVQAKITENAAAEFLCMQREHTPCAGAKSCTAISDELSSIPWQRQRQRRPDVLRADLVRSERIRRAVSTDAQRGL
jgi:glutamate dehydrogenase